MKDEKRNCYSIYLTSEEKKKIENLSKRISPGKKTKPISQIIRKTVLVVSENPDLDFIFDPGVCLNLSVQDIKIREKLYQCMKDNIEILKQHGIELPNSEDGGEIDES